MLQRFSRTEKCSSLKQGLLDVLAARAAGNQAKSDRLAHSAIRDCEFFIASSQVAIEAATGPHPHGIIERDVMPYLAAFEFLAGNEKRAADVTGGFLKRSTSPIAPVWALLASETGQLHVLNSVLRRRNRNMAALCAEPLEEPFAAFRDQLDFERRPLPAPRPPHPLARATSRLALTARPQARTILSFRPRPTCWPEPSQP